MDDDLVMDVSGSWVRLAKKSAAAQLDQLSDASEELFLARHFGNVKQISLSQAELEGAAHFEKLIK